MAPHTIDTTVADRQLGKKDMLHSCKSSSLITSATNNNHRVQMFAAQFPEDSCGCQVRPPNCRLAPRHARHLLQSLLAGDDRDQWLRQQAIQHRLFWWVGQGLICTKLCWQIPSELQFFSTRNAFITILSSRVILPVKMHKRGYYSTVLFL